MSDAPEFYRLTEAMAEDALRTFPIARDVFKDIDIATGRYVPPEVQRFAQYQGKTLYDWIGTQLTAMRIFSNRVFDAFEEAEITGWSTLPVDLHRSGGGGVIDGYRLLVIDGRCGPIDNARSVHIERPRHGQPHAINRVWKGYHFDETTWDGSDVFAPEGTAALLVSARTKAVLERVRATNFAIVALEDVERISLR